MDIEDRLLQGAIELHAHAYPEFSLRMRGRVHEIEWAELARAAGMRAIVMKSQVFPTVERANLVRKVVSGIEVFGGITLNQSIGGLNPLAVEVAGELGGKAVWMPTWGSKNDLSRSQFYLNRMKEYIRTLNQTVPGPESGIEILEGGKLKSVVKEIVQIARDHRMYISSGHLSIQESLVLVEECVKQGAPFTLTHPFSRSVGGSIDDQKEVAKRGGYIEHCFITTMPMHQRLELSRIVEAIQEIGPSQTVLTTDAIQTWNPPPPELMRMYIASLLQLNIEEEAIRRMIQENPVKILGLDDKLGEGVK
ncbi:MAG: DUF6282 family protein [Thermodesulfobacteriota bacterium]|nr:DUF6282 family protein [Thermodesulfobacteriota bacterium]